MKVKALTGPESDHVIAYRFDCPGCNMRHVVNVAASGGAPNWTFNGDIEKPTFSPSILVRTGHHVGNHPEAECEYCKESKRDGHPTHCVICHSFVRDGRIQFLSDCTHHLAGQKVDLPDID